MSRKGTWLEVYNRFDVYEYVTSARWRAERSRSPARKIDEALSSPFASRARFLVTGTIGTGKTTELLRVAELRADREFVVFLDLARHFDRLARIEGLQQVSQWEVCFLVGLAVYRTAQERFGSNFFPRDVESDLQSAWTALAAASGTPPAEVDLGRLAKAIVAAGAAIVGGPAGAVLGSLGAAAESVRAMWNLPMGASKQSLLDDNEQVKTMLTAVNRVIGEVQHSHQPVLLVIDGLDRIRDIARARELFVESNALARLACRVVVCGPFALRHDPSAASVSGFQFLTLVNEPVLDQCDPAKPGPGLAFFFELFLRRTQDLGGTELIAPPLLELLAFYSGGRARDFVKMIRLLAEKAWLADVDTATPDIVDSVIDDIRRLIEHGVHRGHIAVLEAVMRDPDHRLPQYDQLVSELLTMSRLLPYPDHSEWFYPHPLLTCHLLHGTGSTG
jgi:hypothetical protein